MSFGIRLQLCLLGDAQEMYPEDRVLVAYMPSPEDLRYAENQGWYRIPKQSAPKGLHAEYLAFYFGRRFGSEKWAIHYYARKLGHELVSRRQLIPLQPDHPRADALYYKIQIGPLLRLERPIVCLRWRRLTFMHTTWDRFIDATEINDLLVDGGEYVDRLFVALKESGLPAVKNYQVDEPGASYQVPISVLCDTGRVDIELSQIPENDQQLAQLTALVRQQADKRGGPRKGKR